MLNIGAGDPKGEAQGGVAFRGGSPGVQQGFKAGPKGGEAKAGPPR